MSSPLDEKKDDPDRQTRKSVEDNIEGEVEGIRVNASGHVDELQRHFGIWSLCGLALTIDNAWVAMGGSLYIAVCKSPRHRFVESKLLNIEQTMAGLQAFSTNSL